jgi:hypothetical protein
MKSDGEEIVFITGNGGIRTLEKEFCFRIKFQIHIDGGKLRLLIRRELHLLYHTLRVIPYDPIFINERERTCWRAAAKNKFDTRIRGRGSTDIWIVDAKIDESYVCD